MRMDGWTHKHDEANSRFFGNLRKRVNQYNTNLVHLICVWQCLIN